MNNVRLTDYFGPLDTLTVTEELVHDAERFFLLMALATNNLAFKSSCPFQLKIPTTSSQQTNSSLSVNPSSQPLISIEQPAWFKPKTFHTMAIWVIVALEENLWAQ